ncbi:serine hydrolase domain-containing protein [Streptomyces avicenniae]|uniref:serine hydrolase domain-containing protein n=1 Tax=Streptomyces avicenniae TaxID=500153 RepID=UPI00069B0F32|nr:serine hydrolase domain-containing protein [Streptomyces avicenniae]
MTESSTPGADVPLPATRRALDHRLATAQSGGRTPSLLAGLVRDGRLVWSGARGELPEDADPTTVQYRIGSLTKTLTAVAVLRLRDEGLLDLGDRIDAHLPAPHAPGATVAQLLSHTSGLAAEARGPWWERTPGELRPRLADVFGADPHKHPEGRRFHYSNPGYAVLGALVEELRGAPWAEVLREEVLEPLGMSRTSPQPQAPHAQGWAVHPYADVRQPEPAVDTGRMAPAGQLWSTVGDLASFAAFLTGQRADTAVLAPETLAEMRAPAAPPEVADWDTSYGLGLQLFRRGGRLLAGHGGSMPGFLASVVTCPDERIAAVTLANATSGPPVTALATDLLALAADLEPAFPEPWRPLSAADADPALLALTGTWYWGTTPYALRLAAGRKVTLGPAGGAGRRSAFRPDGADGRTWTGLDGYYAGETLRAVHHPDGRVSHLDLGTFVFTREPYDPAAPLPGGADPAGWR